MTFCFPSFVYFLELATLWTSVEIILFPGYHTFVLELNKESQTKIVIVLFVISTTKTLHFTQWVLTCFLTDIWLVSLSFTGITRFDLLGDFGRFNWLGNFYIVLSYNMLFAVVTTLCLVRKFTSAVREELLKALGKFIDLFSCVVRVSN